MISPIKNYLKYYFKINKAFKLHLYLLLHYIKLNLSAYKYDYHLAKNAILINLCHYIIFIHYIS